MFKAEHRCLKLKKTDIPTNRHIDMHKKTDILKLIKQTDKQTCNQPNRQIHTDMHKKTDILKLIKHTDRQTCNQPNRKIH